MTQLNGYTCWGPDDEGDIIEVVAGHVDCDAFNAERDKCVDGDPIPCDELKYGFARIGSDGRLEWTIPERGEPELEAREGAEALPGTWEPVTLSF